MPENHILAGIMSRNPEPPRVKLMLKVSQNVGVAKLKIQMKMCSRGSGGKEERKGGKSGNRNGKRGMRKRQEERQTN